MPIACDMPDPNDKQAFTAAASRAIRYFVKKSQGRAFALFTNAEMMRAVALDLAPFFEAEGITPLVQGTGLSRHVMLDRFRKANDGGQRTDDGGRDTVGRRPWTVGNNLSLGRLPKHRFRFCAYAFRLFEPTAYSLKSTVPLL